jgi:peptidyl-prolyl cis-trans isomerase-like 3
MKSFMIQGGDPTGTGKGGESIWGKHFNDHFHNDIRFEDRGMLAMANNGPDTNASQFFISYSSQPHLNSKYTIFGRVIDGFEVLDSMERGPVGKKNRPLSDIKIETITIHANPLAT